MEAAGAGLAAGVGLVVQRALRCQPAAWLSSPQKRPLDQPGDAASPSSALELPDGCPGTCQAPSRGQMTFLRPVPLNHSVEALLLERAAHVNPQGPSFVQPWFPSRTPALQAARPTSAEMWSVKLLDPVRSWILSAPTAPGPSGPDACYGHRTPSQSATPHLGPAHLLLRLSWEGRGRSESPLTCGLSVATGTGDESGG